MKPQIVTVLDLRRSGFTIQYRDMWGYETTHGLRHIEGDQYEMKTSVVVPDALKMLWEN